MPQLPPPLYLPEVPEAAEWWDQLSAWGTLGAVIVALFVALNEARRRRLDREDTEAAQARMVTVQRSKLHGVRIINHSTQPLLDLEVTAVLIEEPGGRKFVPLASEGLPISDVLSPHGGFCAVRVSQWEDASTGNVVPGKTLQRGDRLSCTYRFMDVHGLRWERRDNSQPKRLRDAGTQGWRWVLFWRR
ncbi:hypothetical protein ACWDXD_19945 [Streptomyces sp. NPDC003314]